MTKGFIIGLFAISSVTAIAQTEVFNETFESGIPVNFTIVDNDGMTPSASTAHFTEAWTYMADPIDTSAVADTVMGSTSYFSPSGAANRWMITPAITVGAYGNFAYWQARSHDPSYPDYYKVLVSTTDTELASFTTLVGNIEGEYATWTSRSVNLSNQGFANQTIYLAFVNTTDDGYALYIDDIRVVVDDPVGIDELTQVAVTVYPNPVSDILKVKSEATIESIEVISLSGASLMTTTDTELSVAFLSEGSYFVKIATDKGTVVRSFVKH